MSNLVECKIAILMDEDGNWGVGDQDDLSDASASLADAGGIMVRRVDIAITMSPPVITELALTVPDDAGTVQAAEVEG